MVRLNRFGIPFATTLLILGLQLSALSSKAGDTTKLETLPMPRSGEKSLFVSRSQLKLNLLLLPMKNLQLSYDFELHPKHTVGAYANYIFPWRRSGDKRNTDSSVISFSNGRFNGYGLTLNYKFYPYGSKNGAPQGIYIGTQFRYQKLQYNVDVTVRGDGVSGNIDFKNSLTSFSAGIEIGYQLHFKNNMLLDFSFFGPRFAHNIFSSKTGLTLSGDVYDELSSSVNEMFGFDIVNLALAIDQPLVKQHFNFIGLRYGISVGYAF